MTDVKALPPLRDMMQILVADLVAAIEKGDTALADFVVGQIEGATILYLADNTSQEEKTA